MSNLLDIEPPNFEEPDELDALNDETFGCNLADINDDWEDQHEKLTGFEPATEPGERSQRDTSHSSGINNFLQFANSSKIAGQLSDDVQHPFYEDIVKKSISNFILDDDLYDDDDDICPDFTSYELEAQNVLANAKPTSNKVEKKTINLESLRPPSPSILPFDDPFMSSVWRPLSPELNLQQQQEHQENNLSNLDSQTNSVQHTPKEPKILTLEELERSMTLNGHGRHSGMVRSHDAAPKPKAIRLEDLEAQFLDTNSKSESTPIPSSNHFMQAPPSTSSALPQVPPNAYAVGKIPTNIMEMAAMSLSKLAIQPQPTIPQTNKVVPPPPGLGSKYNFPGTPSADTKPAGQIPPISYIQKMPTQNAPGSLQSQMAMANAMVNALANLSQLPTNGRPQLPVLPGNMKMPHHSGPMVLDPLVQQEQQRIINRIITPAQAQRFYPSHFGNFSNGRNQDRFAGFMNQKEKDWLLKIFRLQCKVNDPYVEDYYEVNFKVKKATIERRQFLAKQHNKHVDDVEIDAMIQSDPLIVLPELAKVEEEKPKYIQFDNALGKIQVLNTKCPRKLLDVNPDKPSPLNMGSFTSNLIKIERLYEHLLNIEDEDKRMPILPESVIPLHIEKRVQLCHNLFQGLIKPVTLSQKDEGTFFTLINRSLPTLKKLAAEVNPDILSINKGSLLAYRSLLQLRDESQLVVLLCSLLKGSNYRKFIFDSEPQANYGNMLLKALGRIKQTRNLIYIAASMDDSEMITQNKVCLLGCSTIMFISYISLFAAIRTAIFDDHFQTIPSLRR